MSVSADPIVIAAGDTEDLPAVMRIMSQSFDPRYGEAWTATQCSGLLGTPGVWLDLASIDERAIGFAMARLLVDECELLLLAVDPSMQKKGIGTRLLESFVDTARRQGATRLHLEVREGNPAISLYERSGFDNIGRRRGYYDGAGGHRYDALTYARTLRS
ncbi:MAG: ribosomal protein S18-alanine N-acetyltransferase [Sphingomonadaceae bacterium]